MVGQEANRQAQRPQEGHWKETPAVFWLCTIDNPSLPLRPPCRYLCPRSASGCVRLPWLPLAASPRQPDVAAEPSDGTRLPLTQPPVSQDQHDAHEFLEFLLDELHEDVNTVPSKPYVEQQDSAGRPDGVVASEAWGNFKRREDSAIVDMFMWQIKQELVCHVCGHSNVTFDPYRSVSLPLPQKLRLQPVLFVPHSAERPAVRLAVKVPLIGEVTELLAATAALCGCPASSLRASEIYNSKFQRLFKPRSRLEDVKPTDDICVFEVPAGTVAVPVVQMVIHAGCSLERCTACGADAPAVAKISRCTRCRGAAYCGTACQKAHWSKHRKACKAPKPKLFGRPFMLIMSDPMATEADSLKCVRKAAEHFVAIDASSGGAVTGCRLAEVDKFGHAVRRSRLGKPVSEQRRLDWTKFECVALEWHVTDEAALVSRPFDVADDASVLEGAVDDSTPTLAQAFEKFSKPEDLTGDDAW